jgi:hypothetical protein
MRRTANYLLIVLLLVGAVSLWLKWADKPRQDEVARPADVLLERDDITPVPFAPPDSVAADGTAPVHLVVLNGTAQPRLAQQVGLAVTLVGCVTERIGNAPHTHFEKSLLINRRLPVKAAAQLAARLGGVTVIDEKDSRTTEDALLVLGADFDRVCRSLGLSPSP